MPEELSTRNNGRRTKRVALRDRLTLLEEKHQEQGELLAEAIGEIRRLRACVARVKAKKNGAHAKGSC